MTERETDGERCRAAAERIADHGDSNAAAAARSGRAGGSGSRPNACSRAAASSCAARATGCALLSEAERARGVVAFSSGNHAQGVALAARRLGIAAAIVMPADAPAVKVEATRAAGAEIIFYDRATESREEIGARLAGGARRRPGALVRRCRRDRGAGQRRRRDRGAARRARRRMADRAVRRRRPLGRDRPGAAGDANRRSSSPKAGTTWPARSRSGEIVPVDEPAPPTRCDALQTRLVSPLTFGALQRGRRARRRGQRGGGRGGDGLRLPQSADRRRARRRGRAGGLAVREGRRRARRSVVVVSGGNVDPLLYAEILRGRFGAAEPATRPPRLSRVERVDLDRRVAQLGGISLGIDARAAPARRCRAERRAAATGWAGSPGRSGRAPRRTARWP